MKFGITLACIVAVSFPLQSWSEVDRTEIADPYRWLEQNIRFSQEVTHFVNKQNRQTMQFLTKIPEREEIGALLTKLFNYERWGIPAKHGKYYIVSKNDGLQNQPVVYKLDSLNAEPRTLVDPNTWSEDGTVALVGLSIAKDGSLAALAQSTAGSDWVEISIMDPLTGEMLPDHLRWVCGSHISWSHDHQGFYYSRYPEPSKEGKHQQLNSHSMLCYHKIHTDQSEDLVIFNSPENPHWDFGGGVTEDGQFLLIVGYKSTARKYRIWIKDFDSQTVMEVIDNWENEWNYIANDGFIFYFFTDLNAPKKRVVAFDIRQGPAHLVEIIPQTQSPLEHVHCVGNRLICTYLKDTLPLVAIYEMDGSLVREITFPTPGTCTGFKGKRTDTHTFYAFSAFNMPSTIYQYAIETGESTLIFKPNAPIDPDAFEITQVFYPSKDGTKIPLILAHKKGIQLDGTHPTLLYGYGGFGSSLTPSFSPPIAAWITMGGVYAQASLRGGGEYGNAWHEAGKRKNKQNVFDDFIAAAHWLIDNGYTQPSKLAINGASNGGLLVGVAMTQQPHLFAAAIPQVAVMDMLRFHLWTSGRFWVDEYGNPEDPEEYQFLKAYSPYHNLREGIAYPATLVITADTDDRVVPSHSFKFTARLQEVQEGDNPILMRVDSNVGHGAGKPITKIIDQYTDMWAFLYQQLDFQHVTLIDGKK